MKFKVDENLPIEVAQLLHEAGHDVFTIHQQGLVGAKDVVLARVCQDEHRALVTLDIHFAYIRTYPPSEFPGLMVLRLARQDKIHILQILNRILKLLYSEALDGKLWIIEEDKVRIRS